MNLVKTTLIPFILLLNLNQLVAQTPDKKIIGNKETWTHSTNANQQTIILFNNNIANVRFGLQQDSTRYLISITFNANGTSVSSNPKGLSSFKIPKWVKKVIKYIKNNSGHPARTKLINLNRTFTCPKS